MGAPLMGIVVCFWGNFMKESGVVGIINMFVRNAIQQLPHIALGAHPLGVYAKNVNFIFGYTQAISDAREPM